MASVMGTIIDGQIVPNKPVDWPEGTQVEIVPTDRTDFPVGMTEEEQSGTPEEIAAWLAKFDALEPPYLTPQEEAEREAFRLEVRRVTLEAVRRKMGLTE